MESKLNATAGSVGDDEKFNDLLFSYVAGDFTWCEDTGSRAALIAYIDAMLAARAAPGVPAPVAGNLQQQDATLTNEGTMPPFAAPASQRDALVSALRTAEAALADIGDADREPGDDVAWCEKRAADALPKVRAALATAEQITSAQVRGEQAPSQPPAGPSDWQPLPVKLTPAMASVLEFGRTQPVHNTYLNLRAAAPVIPPAAPSEAQRWISTDDRLPDDETPVIILHSGEARIGELRWEHPSHEETFASSRYWDNPHDDGQMWDWPDVTHWMSLPAAVPSKTGGA